MAVTPKGIVTPDASSPYNLITDLNTLASTTDAAIATQKGTASQRTAAMAGAPEGTLWQDTDGIKMIWRKDGAAWVPAVWRWAGTTTQMNAFSQAPDGFEWFDVAQGISFTMVAGQFQGYSAMDRAKSSTQSIPNATWTLLTWPTLSSNTGGITYSSGSFTVPSSGRYLVIAQAGWQSVSSPSGQRVMQLRVNGSAVAQSKQESASATYATIPQISKSLSLVAGDVIGVFSYQSQGSAQNIGVSGQPEISFISIDKVH